MSADAHLLQVSAIAQRNGTPGLLPWNWLLMQTAHPATRSVSRAPIRRRGARGFTWSQVRGGWVVPGDANWPFLSMAWLTFPYKECPSTEPGGSSSKERRGDQKGQPQKWPVSATRRKEVKEKPDMF